MAQGATLNITGTVVVTNIQRGNSKDWVTGELYEAPAFNASSSGQSWELLPIRARIRVPEGSQMPTEGSMLEVRSASLTRSEGEYKNQKTPFWNVAIFSWRELGSPTNNSRPLGPVTVSATPTTKRPVMDDPQKELWEEDVPF